MIRTICLLGIVLFIGNDFLRAQEISTLITDSTKDFEAIHWHPDGRIFVTDYNNGKLYRINLDGTTVTIVDGFSAIAGGGFDREGRFYFAGINNGRMYLLNEDYSYTEVGSGFNQPVTFLQHPTDDNIAYISEYGNSRVTELDLSTGATTPFAINQGINGPDGMIYDRDNNILVANFNNHRINRVNADGDVELFANVPAGGFMGYMAKDDQYVYVCSYSSRKIYRINWQGEVEHIAGNGFSGSIDGEAMTATFTQPNGIAINTTGDTLMIADGNTIRIFTSFKTTTGVKAHNLELEDFVASPNPVISTLNLSFSIKSMKELSYEVISFTGQQVVDRNVKHCVAGKNSIVIDCTRLTKGLYYVRLKDKEGRLFTRNFYRG